MFFWDTLVYQDSPQTIEDLKVAITTEVRAIDAQLCRSTLENFKRRVRACLERRGRPLSTCWAKPLARYGEEEAIVTNSVVSFVGGAVHGAGLMGSV